MGIMPKISIISGIFNCSSTLPQAIRSIQDQTFTDWEWIMCDDGSTDDTLRIAQEFAQMDSRITVLTNGSNMGLSATLNKCLTRASGEYIARMDGDDICISQRFQMEVSFLDEHPNYALVSGWMESFDDNGTYGLVKYPEIPAHVDFLKRSCICHAACMIRRDVILFLNGYNTAEYAYRVEDYDLWVRMYEAGFHAYNFQQVIYMMRDDRNACKRRNFKNRLNESRIRYRVYKYYRLPLYMFAYVLFPIIKGIMPSSLYRLGHRMKLKLK